MRFRDELFLHYVPSGFVPLIHRLYQTGLQQRHPSSALTCRLIFRFLHNGRISLCKTRAKDCRHWPQLRRTHQRAQQHRSQGTVLLPQADDELRAVRWQGGDPHRDHGASRG
ncbi:unnamed protein product, partial [Mycena citricolor]